MTKGDKNEPKRPPTVDEKKSIFQTRFICMLKIDVVEYQLRVELSQVAKLLLRAHVCANTFSIEHG
jgi:hypothetical protein